MNNSTELIPAERKKFILFGILFFIIIGTYWLLRILKNTLFLKIAFPELLGWLPHQGRLLQPTAKLYSTFIILGAVLIYSKLIDRFKKQQLFYIICGLYGSLFLAISVIIYTVEMSSPLIVGRYVLALTGWISYFAIESFGSIIVALFWSFATSCTTIEQAKKGFPIIIIAAQAGAISGSLFMLTAPASGYLWPLFLSASCLVLSIIPCVIYLIKQLPTTTLAANSTPLQIAPQESFIQSFISGLQLLLSRPYLRGVLVISTLYEVAGQIVDYQLQSQAAIAPQFSSALAFGKLMGFFGLAVNTLSLIIASTSTQQVLHHLGIQRTLLIYPICFLSSLLIMLGACTYLGPTAPPILWITFALMMIVKALNYAVNTPTREMLYIPTSYEIMFKSKSWIDMFGERLAETTGARISSCLKDSLSILMLYGTIINIGIVGLWLIAVIIVGKQHQQLIKHKQIVS